MSTELICSTLGLRPDQWPPDHYTLLGLRPGDVDPATVESHVLVRMERLRKYQLAHPEPVTDAMNRLAQALVCLSDPGARAAYDDSLPTVPRRVAVRQSVEDEEPPRPYAIVPAEPLTRAPVPRLPTPVVRPRGDDARRRLYHRLGAARRLLAAWRAVGEYVADPNVRPRRPSEAIEFVGTLLDLRARLAEDAAPSFALPGQPGAIVAGLARQPLPLTTYRQFLPEQRTALAADWHAGQAQLAEIYRDMGRAVRRRQRNAPGRAVRRMTRSLVTDRVDLLAFVLGLLALGLAIIRSL